MLWPVAFDRSDARISATTISPASCTCEDVTVKSKSAAMTVHSFRKPSPPM